MLPFQGKPARRPLNFKKLEQDAALKSREISFLGEKCEKWVRAVQFLILREIEKSQCLLGLSVEPADGGGVAGRVHTDHEVDDSVAYRGQYLWGRTSPYSARVFSERYVSHIVQFVLDSPVLSDQI